MSRGNTVKYPAKAYLGLGGNIGDVVKTMAEGLGRLNAEDGICVVNASPVYRTPPWGITDQDWFYNACAEVSTTLAPEELLAACLATERHFGRIREVRWGPRTLDIDILVFGDVEISIDQLTLPHPRMKERAFVLKPLADIAPDIDIESRPISEQLAKLDCSELKKMELPQDWWQGK